MTAPRVVIVGGGAAGLSAAYTLRQRGVDCLLLEAGPRVGGRLGGDRVDGFALDEGADFFCDSYDETFRLCRELDLPLVRSSMNLGWYRHGRWVVTTPIRSVGTLVRTLGALATLGFLAPRAVWAGMKLVREINRQSAHLRFSSDCRIVEIDDAETFGAYLDRLGVPESLRITFKGFLEMTMGDVERAGAAYMRTYLAEMLLKAEQIYVPERGAGALTHALAAACGDVVRVSTPVRRVEIEDGAAARVIVDDGPIAADAVICALPATHVADVIPDLPEDARRTLGRVTYSSGCRVVIGLDHPPLPPGWNGALYPEDETPLLLDRSINLPAIAPEGKSTLDLLVGRERAEAMFPLDDDEIRRRLLADARRHAPPGSRLPADDEGLFTRVYRWPQAVCMMAPGMFREVAAMREALGGQAPNLFLAGDYTRVPCVNGAIASGVGAATEAAERLAAGAGEAAS